MTNSTDTLWKLNATQIIKLLEEKDISPEEVLDSNINRINEVNPSVNAIVTLCSERAKNNIGKNKNKTNNILHNIPVLIKDITEVEGVKTTFGSKLYENNISKKSDILVTNIEKNGGIILGKTNTPELAAGSNTFNDVFGTTKNPWNLELSAGGSSGGSGAALASGMAWFATGTDLGGSLRNPASWNGVVGLRATPGLIAHGPPKMPFNNLSLSGPMARNVKDLSVFFKAMISYDIKDPTSIKSNGFAKNVNLDFTSNDKYKVGVTADFDIFPCSNEIKEMTNNTSKLIEHLGHDVVHSFPNMHDAEEAFQIFRAYIFYNTYGFLLEKKNNVKQDIIWNIEKGKNLKVDDLIKADNIRKKLYENISHFFNDHDFLICPSSSVAPFSHDTKWVKKINQHEFNNYVSWLMICGSISLTNCPSIAIPTSISQNGAPIGIQIIAPPFEDLKLLEFAKNLEDEINIATMLPVNPND